MKIKLLPFVALFGLLFYASPYFVSQGDAFLVVREGGLDCTAKNLTYSHNNTTIGSVTVQLCLGAYKNVNGIQEDVFVTKYGNLSTCNVVYFLQGENGSKSGTIDCSKQASGYQAHRSLVSQRNSNSGELFFSWADIKINKQANPNSYTLHHSNLPMP